MNANDFLLNFPEFGDIETVLVAAKLNMAAARMGGPDVSVWGNQATPTPANALGPTMMTISDMAQGNYAAHLLISSPFGTQLRLDPKGNGRSSYLNAFEDLELAVAGGFMSSGVVI